MVHYMSSSNVAFAQKSLAQLPQGKGAALCWLSGRIQSADIPAFLLVPVKKWREKPSEVQEVCEKTFGGVRVAVRSDAAIEDGLLASHAGEFRTVLDVCIGQLAPAVDEVVSSLPGHAADGVIIQRMAPLPRYVGVASTHRIADGAPWYCIEWAEHDTASVTGGRANGRQVCVARDAADALVAEPFKSPEALALRLLKEVEDVAGNLPLEIEFVLCEGKRHSLTAHLLQMRPLATPRHWPAPGGRPGRGRLPSLHFLRVADQEPGVEGSGTVLSLMADWNPAELIGAHPRPLALSLFKELIADGVWWQARARLGYAPVPVPHIPLLRVLRGRPFVDVRRSANSLVPAGLEPATRARLVDHWVRSLCQEPALHDKVEFRIFRSVQDFGLGQWEDSGLSRQAHMQWKACLRALTAGLIGTTSGTALEFWSRIVSGLERDVLAGWTWGKLLDRCREGTLAFAALARLAFAGESQLRSAVVRGALTADRALSLRAAARRSFPSSTHTAANSGHLRPGTFDITQPAWSGYGDAPETLAGSRALTETFVLRAHEIRALESLLQEAGLPHCSSQWITFVQRSASAREWAKFVFSRHLSAALEDIATLAKDVGMDREQSSWLTLAQLRRGMELSPRDRSVLWLRWADRARQVHAQEARLVTGPVLRTVRDRDIADSLGALPNFVGVKTVRGPLVLLDDPAPRGLPELLGAVVLVSKADPGFDWLFGRGVVGLITEWGGANSHMAIRCAEFGLSAAIGCGPSVYASARLSRSATIDPGAQSLWLA